MTGQGDVPLTIRTGDDESVTITFSDKATGTAINLTGRTYRAQVRRTPTDSTSLASWVCTLTNAAGGVLTLTMALTDILEYAIYTFVTFKFHFFT
jgi:hypothetical protein